MKKPFSVIPPERPTPAEFLASMPSVTPPVPPAAPEQPQEAPQVFALPILPPPPAKPRLQRLTIDISADLHLAIKTSCLARGTTIKDEIEALLKLYFPVK